jgi:hypothetical protein
LPIVKRIPVTIDPSQTCFHFILASGKILNIKPKSTDITPRKIKIYVEKKDG